VPGAEAIVQAPGIRESAKKSDSQMRGIMNAMGSYAARIAAGLGFSLILAQQGVGQSLLTAPQIETQPAKEVVQIPKGTLMQVELERRARWRHLAPNSVLEGRLILPVFAGNEIAVSKGTKVALTIESAKRAGNDSGKWRKAGNAVVRAFNPLEKGRPPEYVIQLSKTELVTPQGKVVVAATALRAGYAAMIKPRVAKSGEGLQTTENAASGSMKGRQTVVLQVDQGVSVPTPSVRSEREDASGKRKARAFLLTQLSSSQSKKDDVFQARLAEPVRLGDKLFEAGSLLEGRVSQSTRPRMLSRAGSLYLRVDRITSPQGTSIAVDGTLGAVEAEPGAKYVLDEEGGLRGLKPGVKNALVDLSVAYAIGKVVDDVAETPIRAVAAAMSDAAVANTARYFGLGASAVFLVTRHGRDVYLPQYSTIEMDFGRYGEEATAFAYLQRP
jgi:hypothetical protein